MAKYRKKPVVIEAEQWWKNGDHSEDYSVIVNGDFDSKTEASVVRYFRHPQVPSDSVCKKCGEDMLLHGWINTLEGGHIVCPGDWIVTGIQGEKYPCKPDIFEATYEKIDDTGN